MSDVPYVYELEKKVFGQSLEKSMLYDELLHNDMAHYFIALEAGDRIGYFGLWVTKPHAQILNLVVAKGQRRKGYGETLLKKGLETCRSLNVDTLSLEVRPSNKAALALYEGQGFDIAARRKNYYNNGEDAFLMTKKIGGFS